MDEILLYLTIKYKSEWIAIYDSLQKREKISIDHLNTILDKIDCKYLSLIDNLYSENLKKIYKPPFGLFYYGNINLINTDSVTVIGNVNSENLKYIEKIKKMDLTIAWYQLGSKQLTEILINNGSNNIFVYDRVGQNNITYKQAISDQDTLENNLFVSEVYDIDKSTQYDDQVPERIYFGLTRKILIIDKIGSKQLLGIIKFAKNENCEIYVLKSLNYKTFNIYKKHITVKEIDSIDEIEKFFSLKN